MVGGLRVARQVTDKAVVKGERLEGQGDKGPVHYRIPVVLVSNEIHYQC
jgi:hypothetical protein